MGYFNLTKKLIFSILHIVNNDLYIAPKLVDIKRKSICPRRFNVLPCGMIRTKGSKVRPYGKTLEPLRGTSSASVLSLISTGFGADNE